MRANPDQKGKKSLQKSIISYVPKSKRMNKDHSEKMDFDDNTTENDSSENADDEIEQVLLTDSNRKKYIKKHFTYIDYRNNHSHYICNEMKFEDGIAYSCSYQERDNRLDFYHVHHWEKIENEKKTPEQRKSISEYEMLLKKISILAGHYNFSFSVIESEQFWDILKSVFV